MPGHPDATRFCRPVPEPTSPRHVPHRGCFCCGDANHFAQDCPAPADIRMTDVLDEVIHQLGGEMLEELVARIATTEALTDDPALEDFSLRGE